MFNIPYELLHNILAYTGHLRIMKIKMDQTNIKYLFDNDKEIYPYLYCKTESSMPCLNEQIYLEIIELLNDKSIKMDMIFEKISEFLESMNRKISYQTYTDILDTIIHDYNTYYLDDSFYYKGNWEEQIWRAYLEN